MTLLIKVKDTDNVIGLKEDIAMRLEGVADIERIDVNADNGVIVPPCNVGDTVYIIDDGDEGAEPYVLDVLVTAIGYDIVGFWITVSLPLGMKMSAHIGERSFGKTVFFTRDEAERALKGGADNG